ncbi:MAG: periplasmic heavy metal sensor [Alphaproteobacteria bacterium]|nr:periplasmic heavy metal sensor [Alphaproteobacteria bacterium]
MKGLFDAPAFRVLCLVSILANALFIGLVASKWGPLARKPAARAEVSLTLDRYFASLPEPARSTFSESFERQSDDIMPSLNHLLDTRRRVAQTLRQDPLDITAAEAVFAELRQANLVAQKPLHKVLIETAAALPPAERPRLLHLDYGLSRDWRQNFGVEDPAAKPDRPKPQPSPFPER